MRGAFLLFLLAARAATAHVGSPDVFYEGKAGPYPVQISIRPPTVIPGVAEVEIRLAADGIQQVRVTPLPLSGVGADHPPSADIAKRSAADPRFYVCPVWMMAFGSYQVRVNVEGPLGTGTVAVPIPSVALQVKKMDAWTGVGLSLLMALLVAGFIGIAGAAAREASFPPASRPLPPTCAAAAW